MKTKTLPFESAGLYLRLQTKIRICGRDEQNLISGRRPKSVPVAAGRNPHLWPLAKIRLCVRRPTSVSVAADQSPYLWPLTEMSICGRRQNSVYVFADQNPHFLAATKIRIYIPRLKGAVQILIFGPQRNAGLHSLLITHHVFSNSPKIRNGGNVNPHFRVAGE